MPEKEYEVYIGKFDYQEEWDVPEYQSQERSEPPPRNLLLFRGIILLVLLLFIIIII